MFLCRDVISLSEEASATELDEYSIASLKLSKILKGLRGSRVIESPFGDLPFNRDRQPFKLDTSLAIKFIGLHNALPLRSS